MIIPQWPVPENVGALMTTRLGGVSAPPFDSLNLGDNTHDQPCAIAQNKQYLQDAVEADNQGQAISLAFLNQVHGTHVLNLDRLEARQAVAAGKQFEADASLTTKAGVACVVRVADCMPILFWAPGIVAAAHAGWRGAASGVIEKTVEAMVQEAACSPEQIHAWLGPCIGPTAFEVGANVRDAFAANASENLRAFQALATPGKWLADLPMLVSLALNRLGVVKIDSDSRCTYQEEKLFFSYRRDHVRLGGTGRMAACIWLKDQ